MLEMKNPGLIDKITKAICLGKGTAHLKATPTKSFFF